jgi:hypothetical protein
MLLMSMPRVFENALRKICGNSVSVAEKLSLDGAPGADISVALAAHDFKPDSAGTLALIA